MLISAFFTQTGVPTEGLSPTIRIRDLTTGSALITDAAMTEKGDGWYAYAYGAYSVNTEYGIRCDAGSELNGYDRYAFAGNEDFDVPSAVAGLNNVSGADVNAQCDTAIADAGLATYADMVSSFSGLNDIAPAMVTNATETALALYDGPTHGEMVSSISGLNNLSSAEANAACDLAFTDYNPPTQAEMVSSFSGIMTAVDSVATYVDNINSFMARIAGLNKENMMTDQVRFTGSNMTQARVRCFSSSAFVPAAIDGSETAGLIATYISTASYTAGDNLAGFWMEYQA